MCERHDATWFEHLCVVMNGRTHVDMDGNLTDVERQEYQFLQRKFMDAALQASPAPSVLDVEQLEQFRQKLEADSEQPPK